MRGLSYDLADGEVAGFFALGGKGGEPARGFAIVELPVGFGPGTRVRPAQAAQASVSERIAVALEAHAAHARDLELALAEKTAYVDELVAERDEAVERERAALASRSVLEERVAALDGDVKQWRSRASIAEGELLRARLDLQATQDGSAQRELAQRTAASEAELDEVRGKLEQATRGWRAAEAKSDAVWRRVGEIQAELDGEREKAVARSAEQRRTSQLAMVKAAEEASQKLVSVRDQLQRTEARCEELEARLRESEAARAALEARLGAGSAAADEPGDE